MKLKYKINLVSMAILLGVVGTISAAGILAINEVTYDLNRQLLSKEVSHLLLHMQSAQEVLKESGLTGVGSYVRAAQDETIQDVQRHTSAEAGELLVVALNGKSSSDYQVRLGETPDAACIEQMLQSQRGTLECSTGGGQRFFSFATFPEWNWLVGISVKSDAMLDARNRFIGQVLIIVLLSLALGVAMFFWFTSIVVKPIQQLVEATRQISQGKWDAHLPPTMATGELAQLTHAFQDMSSRLAEMYSSLQRNMEEIKQSREALRASEEKYRGLVELLPQIIFEADCEGNLLFLNRNAFDEFGYRSRELGEGMGLYELLTPADRERAKQNLSRILHGEKLGMMEYEAVRKDGGKFPAIALMSPIIREDKAVGLRGILVNITERKALEDGLVRAREFLHNILNNLPDPIFVKNEPHQWVLVNDALCQFLGHKRDELLGKSDYDFFPTEEADVFYEQDDLVFATGAPHENEERITDAQGRQHIILTKKAVFQDVDGKRVLLGNIRDITERKQMEEELLRIQKLESIGLLAGGIAHDFNNILSAILGNLSLAKTYVQPTDPVHDNLEETERACLRARGLTQQLLTFSRGGAPVKKSVAIGDLIREWGKFALRGSNVTGEFHMAEDLWPVEIDEGQMNQVVNNLVINAVQAMPRGGAVKVSAENVIIGESAMLPLQAGRYVKLSLADQGCGIPVEILPRIFDPYFSTKETGSGLGLATAHSIINRHSGYITVESQPELGSVFHIYLPAARHEAPKEGKERSLTFSGKGRILVMDDDDMLRKLVNAMLCRLGYEVVAAADGAEAIDIYKNSAHPFAAVIMDLTVPGGMGGKEAIKLLREFDPKVKAIVSSGYSIDPVMADYRSYGFLGRVSKPYDMAELSKVLHDVLNMDA